MIDYCFACGGDHPHGACPLLRPPAPPSVDSRPEEHPRTARPNTQYEEMFGEGAEGLLLDVLDRPDTFDEDQRDLARSILSGEEAIPTLGPEGRQRLDEIGRDLVHLDPFVPPVREDAPRPTYVRTRKEMEDF